MNSAGVTDDAGFSSFFLDYKLPSLISSAYALNQHRLSIKREPIPTPDTSISSTSIISTVSLPSTTPTTLTQAQVTRTLVLKRKLFDNNLDDLKAAIDSITLEDRIELLEIEKFAAYFKRQRMNYGCTQMDVGVALGKKYGTDFSQTTISRFEALNLSFKNMCKLRPLLKEWLAEADFALGQGVSMTTFLQRAPIAPVEVVVPPKLANAKSKKTTTEGRQRKKRTFIDKYQSIKLTEEFEKNDRPSPNYFKELAERLKLDINVIRVWYSNHRQRIIKMEDQRLALEGHKKQKDKENVKGAE